MDVAQVEGGGDGVCPAGAVFPGTEEEEEGNPSEVSDSFFSWRTDVGN